MILLFIIKSLGSIIQCDIFNKICNLFSIFKKKSYCKPKFSLLFCMLKIIIGFIFTKKGDIFKNLQLDVDFSYYEIFCSLR